MKYFYLLILIFLIAPFSCIGQDDKQRLLTEISKSDVIECAHLGAAGADSKLFRKADSLNDLTSVKEKLAIIKDLNYILKFYSFRGILYSSDSLGYSVLKKYINDSTKVSYFCSCSRSEIKFNELILSEYYKYIKYKYSVGGSWVLGGDYKVYQFPKANKKIWKSKLKELKEFINDSNEKQLVQMIENLGESEK